MEARSSADGPGHASIDRVVHGGKESRRDRKPQAPGSRLVENELEADRLHYRYRCRSCTLQYLTDVAASLAVHPTDVGPITHQQAGRSQLAREGNGRKRTSLRKRGDLVSPVEEERVCRC